METKNLLDLKVHEEGIPSVTCRGLPKSCGLSLFMDRHPSTGQPQIVCRGGGIQREINRFPLCWDDRLTDQQIAWYRNSSGEE